VAFSFSWIPHCEERESVSERERKKKTVRERERKKERERGGEKEREIVQLDPALRGASVCE